MRDMTEELEELEEFDYDEDGEISVLFYILGDIPIKVTCEDSFPFRAERGDTASRSLVLDNSMIRLINNADDVRKVSEAVFRDYCLSKGIKPS
ncbi:MAG: hypothetical protein KDI90_11290 [Alphaproteobacteria bacterium]|nr:hypothetical protein [Alphaproteobacteria bacterium]MCB9974380.1 hypothetical protein [Rhodospirillales bacterium]